MNTLGNVPVELDQLEICRRSGMNVVLAVHQLCVLEAILVEVMTGVEPPLTWLSDNGMEPDDLRALVRNGWATWDRRLRDTPVVLDRYVDALRGGMLEIQPIHTMSAHPCSPTLKGIHYLRDLSTS